jgi:hypothetical protein
MLVFAVPIALGFATFPSPAPDPAVPARTTYSGEVVERPPDTIQGLPADGDFSAFTEGSSECANAWAHKNNCHFAASKNPRLFLNQKKPKVGKYLRKCQRCVCKAKRASTDDAMPQSFIDGKCNEAIPPGKAGGPKKCADYIGPDTTAAAAGTTSLQAGYARKSDIPTSGYAYECFVDKQCGAPPPGKAPKGDKKEDSICGGECAVECFVDTKGAIVVESKKEFKTFETKNCEANKYDTIETEEECTVAAVKLGWKQTAKDDGHTSGVDDDPKGCYVDEKGNVMFNKGGTNKGSCTKDKKCICSKCPGGGATVPVNLGEGKFTLIGELPENAYTVVISVSANADLDVFLMEEGELPCLPADAKKATNDCKENVLLDSKRNPDPNYAKCLAGFKCMNNAMCNQPEACCKNPEACNIKDAYDPDDKKHTDLFDAAVKKKDVFDPEDHFSWPEDHFTFTKELAGATGKTCADEKKTCDDDAGKTCLAEDKKCAPTMKIFFSGDDYQGEVTAEDPFPIKETVVIEKTTEKISLWVYAYPDSGTVKGSVEYKFEKVSPCDV